MNKEQSIKKVQKKKEHKMGMDYLSSRDFSEISKINFVPNKNNWDIIFIEISSRKS